MIRELGKAGVIPFRRWSRKQEALPASLETLLVALPCSQTPGGPPRQTIAAFRCCPRNSYNEGSPNNKHFEAQSHGFTTRCLRLKTSSLPPTKARFRWVVNRTGEESMKRRMKRNCRRDERTEADPPPGGTGREQGAWARFMARLAWAGNTVRHPLAKKNRQKCRQQIEKSFDSGGFCPLAQRFRQGGLRSQVDSRTRMSPSPSGISGAFQAVPGRWSQRTGGSSSGIHSLMARQGGTTGSKV